MKMIPDKTNWKKVGIRTINVLQFGTFKTKDITRTVYSEKTQIPYKPIYWIELYKGEWVNTTRKGIQNGMVLTETQYRKSNKEWSRRIKPKIIIGSKVRIRGTAITGKVTHIRYDPTGEDPTKYKVAGRYWNESSVGRVKPSRRVSR